MLYWLHWGEAAKQLVVDWPCFDFFSLTRFHATIFVLLAVAQWHTGKEIILPNYCRAVTVCCIVTKIWGLSEQMFLVLQPLVILHWFQLWQVVVVMFFWHTWRWVQIDNTIIIVLGQNVAWVICRPFTIRVAHFNCPQRILFQSLVRTALI